MKFIHISDLHLGKYLCGTSMIDNQDQVHWIQEFEKVVEEEQVKVILISGDVYDRSIAPREAIKLYSTFITNLANKGMTVFIISGNHDSGIRLSSMNDILSNNGIHIAGEITANVKNVTLEDEYGEITFWLVPYIFPAAIEQVMEIKGIKDYTEAMKTLLDHQNIDYSKRNVILSHQTVSVLGQGPELGGSEEMIGGVSGIDVSVYEDFDYVALGHIHAAQKVKHDYIRYAGSPLCYHFDETKHATKGCLVVDLKEKGNVSVSMHPIAPLHPLRQVEGTLDEIIEKERNISSSNEYIKVVLTDDVVPVNALNTLETLFETKGSYLMETIHRPTRLYSHDFSNSESVEEKSIEESFHDFYSEKHNGQFPDEEESNIIHFICEQIMNSDKEDKPDVPDAKDIDALIHYVLGLEE